MRYKEDVLQEPYEWSVVRNVDSELLSSMLFSWNNASVAFFDLANAKLLLPTIIPLVELKSEITRNEV